ncbi:MAG: septation protein A [Rickettsiaceae bacterium]|nr:MAG: septation protein A [Rickettsiaceae bacterium]
MIKFITELGPLVAFFIGYKHGGIQAGTLYMLVASIAGLVIYFVINRKVHNFALISSGILLVSASITLITGNPVFIKIKPTILYVVFACAFYISALRNKPLMKYMLNSAIPLQEQCWNILSYRFSVFFSIMAILNEFVWRNFEEITWVKFKVFGALPITLLFILLQLPLILKNRIVK